MEKETIQISGKELTFEVGALAKQAAGAALVRYADTVVLAAVTVSEEPKEGRDFLALTVDYREKTYAAGRIPGGFFKREGRPRDKETLTSRLVDRSLRPLFPEGFAHEIQVSITVLSSDQENDSDIPAILAASLALGVSEIPFLGPIGAIRVGEQDGKIVFNQTFSEREACALDMVVSGTQEALIMVEGGAMQIPEATILSALTEARTLIRQLIGKQETIIKKIGKAKMTFSKAAIAEDLQKAVSALVLEKVREAIRISHKEKRDVYFQEVKRHLLEKLLPTFPEKEKQILTALEDLFTRETRERILKEGVRTDGRKTDEVRPIEIQVGYLPRTHGSALFTRGQTQALVTTTLGTPHDMQIMDDLEGEYKKRFMLHYNFPSFSTGETKPNRGPGRREIGHGALAERALKPVIPDEERFPYTLRVVSEILESNGSSSMATVCGGSLALMDAGVPISEAVAGIAMGLIQEGERRAILTDILGLEDHLGDMDFKVAGTRKGVTAIQMDIKTLGISLDVLGPALEQARRGRLFILEKMDAALAQPREELSGLAPRLVLLSINPAKIKDVIGGGGKTIRKIQQETSADIDVEDDGRVFISAPDEEALQAAIEMVKFYTADVEIGKIYKGRVVNLMKFGAFVEVIPGKDGLCHISQLDEKRVERVEDVVSEGDEIYVKVMEVDKQGRINLSRKMAMRELAKGAPSIEKTREKESPT